MIKSILMTACFLAMLISGHAQSVSISFERIRELQLDEKNIQDVTLTNRGGRPVTVIYRATVGLMGTGKVLEIESVPFEIGPGSRLLSTYPRSEFRFNYRNPDFRAIRDLTGTWPAGNFELCVELEVVSDPASLPVYGCMELYKPSNFNLMLIIPDHNSVLEPGLQPHFSWSAVSTEAGIIRKLSFVFKLAEKHARQQPEEAIKRNPLMVHQKNLDNPMLLYPSNARMLEKGKKYVWQVDAYFGRIFLGSSEVWQFSLEEREPVLTVTPTTSYIDIGSSLGQAELYFYETVKFGYRVTSHTRSLTCTLFKAGDEEKLQEATLKLRPGDNRLDFPIQELALKHMEDYVLEVYDGVVTYRLPFKFLNPDRIQK